MDREVETSQSQPSARSGSRSGRTGRPRTFDKDVALRQAMQIFWERGYEGASIPLLTEAMGIRSPSLYAAFGDKRSLLAKAVALYMREEGAVALRALNASPHPRECIEAMLRDTIDMLTAPGRPRGCLIVLGAFHSCDGAIDRIMADRRNEVRQAVRSLLENSQHQGVKMPALPHQLESLFTTFLHGLSIRIYDGETREELHGSVDALMAMWSR